MLNTLVIEKIKTKRTFIRQLLWLYPFFITVIVLVIFAPTGYVIQSVINQWSIIWLPLFLALIAGLLDRREKNSTDYKLILSSPCNLFDYELGRILHVAVLTFISSLFLIIFIALMFLLSDSQISPISCVLAILGIWLVNLWEIPLYIWFSRITNMYVTIILAFAGIFSGLAVNNYVLGKIWPFTWTELFPVSLIKININGLPLKAGTTAPNNYWTLIVAILLFVLVSYLAANSFRKQVVKNA